MAVIEARTRTTGPGPVDALRWGTLLVVLSGIFMSTLDVFIVNVAIPSIQADLHAGTGAIEWVVAGFGLAVAALVITAGRLGDLLGRRRLYAVGLALFTVASAACGLAPTAGLLVEARVLQGIAAALLMPQVLVILSATFAGSALVTAFTAYGLTMGVAAVFGQLIGGALIEGNLLGLGWRGCFLINVPIGLAALALIRRTVPPTPGSGRARLDLGGVLLVTAALVAAVLPLIQGRQHGWPLWTWLSLGAAAVLLAAFTGWQRRLARRGSEPLIDLRMFRERTYSVGLAAQLVFSVGLASFFFVFALYLQQGRGLDALEAGELFSAIGAGYLVTSTLAGRIAGRLGRQTVAVGALLMVAGLLGLHEIAGRIGATGSLLWLTPTLALDGAGMGLVIAPLSMTVLGGVAPERAGAASGTLSTVMQVGGALGVALIGVIFYGAIGDPAADIPHAFAVSLWFEIAIAVAVAVLIQLLPRTADRGGNR